MPSLILTCLLMTASNGPAEVRTLDGNVTRGTLVDLNDRQVVVSTSDKPVTVPLAELQQIRFGEPAPAGAPAAWIELTDGSTLPASQCSLSSGTFQLTLSSDEVFKLPARAVRSIRFQEPTPALAAEWSKIHEQSATTDRIVVRKREHLDFVEGVLKEIDNQAAILHMDGRDVRFSRGKLEGLILFAPRPEQSPAVTVVVTGRDGSRVRAATISLADARLTLTTPSGARLVRPLSAVADLDFTAGKTVYLSELEPDLAQWTPYFPAGKLAEPLGKLFRPRKNQALLSGETAGDDGALLLRFPGENGLPEVRSYAKGLALHSRSRVVYDLKEKFRHFAATAGIDARLGQQGNVRLHIEGDGRELFSATITGQDVPRNLNLDIQGVKQLILTVDFGGQLDVGDYLDLCDARLVR